jgi:ribose 5-phosphate isomerase B
MKIIMGSDHAGFDLKTVFKAHLEKKPENEIFDTGVFNKESADYPVIGHQVAQAIANAEYRRGILICGTGIGMSITANRYNGVRAALCHNLYTTRMSRLHNNANILVLGARAIGEGIALEMLDIFLKTQFEGGRHQARLDQI